jgi:hypothetical protein
MVLTRINARKAVSLHEFDVFQLELALLRSLQYTTYSIVPSMVSSANKQPWSTTPLKSIILPPAVINTDKIRWRSEYTLLLVYPIYISALQPPECNEKRAFNRNNMSEYYILYLPSCLSFVLGLAMDVFTFYPRAPNGLLVESIFLLVLTCTVYAGICQNTGRVHYSSQVQSI